MTAALPPDATAFAEDFQGRVKGVVAAQFVTTDGMKVSNAPGLSRQTREHLAARVSGLFTLAAKSGQLWNPKAEPVAVKQDNEIPGHGWLFLRAAGENTVFAVMAEPGADRNIVTYEMEKLAEKVKRHTGTASREDML